MSWRGRVPTSYGPGAIRAVPSIVRRRGAHRVLLICGKRSFEASGASEVLPDLRAVSKVQRWSEFAPNTDYADLEATLEVVRSFQPDLILGVGGGSAMDLAKLASTFDAVPQGRLPEAIASARPTSRTCSLVLAPTTSGSGSESTHFAVVYIGERKYSVAGPAMYPDHIVLDPALSLSGSGHQRATSGIDAVCQAIEGLWAVGATAHSRRRARWALRFLVPSIRSFVHEPKLEVARAMCVGSHLAGQAIDVSKTTAAHALSYAITKRYGIDHGSAVALTLGAFIDVHIAAAASELQTSIDDASYRHALDFIRVVLGIEVGESGHDRFKELLRSISLPTSLSEVGVTSATDVHELAESVNTERLQNNPVRLDSGDLVRILTLTTGSAI